MHHPSEWIQKKGPAARTIKVSDRPVLLGQMSLLPNGNPAWRLTGWLMAGGNISPLGLYTYWPSLHIGLA